MSYPMFLFIALCAFLATILISAKISPLNREEDGEDKDLEYKKVHSTLRSMSPEAHYQGLKKFLEHSSYRPSDCITLFDRRVTFFKILHDYYGNYAIYDCLYEALGYDYFNFVFEAQVMMFKNTSSDSVFALSELCPLFINTTFLKFFPKGNLSESEWQQKVIDFFKDDIAPEEMKHILDGNKIPSDDQWKIINKHLDTFAFDVYQEQKKHFQNLNTIYDEDFIPGLAKIEGSAT